MGGVLFCVLYNEDDNFEKEICLLSDKENIIQISAKKTVVGFNLNTIIYVF